MSTALELYHKTIKKTGDKAVPVACGSDDDEAHEDYIRIVPTLLEGKVTIRYLWADEEDEYIEEEYEDDYAENDDADDDEDGWDHYPHYNI